MDNPLIAISSINEYTFMLFQQIEFDCQKLQQITQKISNIAVSVIFFQKLLAYFVVLLIDAIDFSLIFRTNTWVGKKK